MGTEAWAFMACLLIVAHNPRLDFRSKIACLTSLIALRILTL